MMIWKRRTNPVLWNVAVAVVAAVAVIIHITAITIITTATAVVHTVVTDFSSCFAR